jgi:hypothetical protein
MQIELTDDNWFTGAFYLNSCSVYLPSDKSQMSLSVDRRQLEKQEIDSITALQKELFENEVRTKVLPWKKIFSENYRRSEMKEKYLSDEILDFHLILFNEADRNYKIETYELDNESFVSLHLNNTIHTFPRNDLQKIRQYILRHQKKGLLKIYNFIHSPNFSFAFCANEKLPQVYAEAAWNYHQYLINFESLIQDTIIKKSTLSISQIALIHVYNAIKITRSNSKQIAIDNNHSSGDKLYQKYCLYSKAVNRKGCPDPFSKNILNNKIEMMEGVLEYLNEEARQRATDEIKILKNFYENE